MFLAMYVSIISIGPGLYNASNATISSKHEGFNFLIKLFIPSLSSWNRPKVYPLAINEYTFLSS